MMKEEKNCCDDRVCYREVMSDAMRQMKQIQLMMTRKEKDVAFQ